MGRRTDSGLNRCARSGYVHRRTWRESIRRTQRALHSRRQQRSRPAQYSRGLSNDRARRDNGNSPLRRACPHLAGFSLPELQDAAVMTAPAVSTVVPVFNEEEHMAILQSELRDALAGLDHEIIFVDDGSSDGSAAKIEKAPQGRGIRFEEN